ncbi:sensor histidine kinase [Porifericola rhodea]|uniref:sensor histidine kinase n=1 Tax=Porifericola rhodea TaxID=930972 RepID=UPI002666FFBB|nr:sensor histidine kinase [Porifericola rhodea]WKN30665.1 sensor histidine kinase [Porifericola rhodea]
MSAADIIRINKESILDRWTQSVLEEIPGAEKYNLPILKNNIPDLLDAMVDALASDDARDVVYKSESHGRERAHKTKYTILHIVKEYHLLKGTLFKVIDDNGDNISKRERDGIMYAIDQALEQSTEAFMQIREHEKKTASDKAKGLMNNMEEQNLMRDQFIAALSHDIRGPLTNTLQLVELLEEQLTGPDTEFTNKLLNGIKMSTLRSNELINNLLDVNLIQSGNPIPIEKEEKDLLQVVSDALHAYKPSLQARIRLQSTKDKIVGQWDADALYRALDNLISNAIKYGSEEGPITISFDKQGNFTLITVHNEGNPIPPEKLDKLFTLYYRTKEKKAKGWGLGLTLVHGIIKAHNGNIEVQSTAQEGTTFRIRIPV